MRSFGAVLISLAVFLLGVAILDLAKPNSGPGILLEFLPGILALTVGLSRVKRKQPALFAESETNDAVAIVAESVETTPTVDPEDFKIRAILGTCGGLGVMALGSGMLTDRAGAEAFALPVMLAGWAWFIGGCVNLARYKGQSPWLGFLGYLCLPGPIVLMLLPNRRRPSATHSPAEADALNQTMRQTDLKSNAHYFAVWTPLSILVFLAILVGGYMTYRFLPVADSEWQELVRNDLGFRALVPGEPTVKEETSKADVVKIQITKFTVRHNRRNEVYVINSLRMPEEVIRAIGDSAAVVETGRKDVVNSTGGKIVAQRPIEVQGYPGVELDIVSPTMELIEVRVIATPRQILEVFAEVRDQPFNAEARRKFFDSIQILPEG